MLALFGSADQRWADLEHSPAWTGRSDQYAVLAESLGELIGTWKLHPDHQPLSAHGHIGQQALQPCSQQGTDLAGASDQAGLLDDVQYRQRCHTRNRIAAEGAEVLVDPAELGGDLVAGDQRRDRMPVAHRLAESDEVRRQAEVLEAPEVLSTTPEAGLHLVSEEQAAAGTDLVLQSVHEFVPRGEDARAAEHTVDCEQGDIMPSLLQLRPRPAHSRAGRDPVVIRSSRCFEDS